MQRTGILLPLLLCMATLAAAEQLPQGHPSIGDAIRDSTPPEQAGIGDLPNEGSVLDVIQTDAYTYIEVEAGGGQTWLATTRTEVTKGDRLRFGGGVSMHNFYSNTLKREFPVIVFVEAVRVVQ